MVQHWQHVGAVLVLRARRIRTRTGGAILGCRLPVVDRQPARELRHRSLDAEQILRRSMSTVVSSNVAGGICEATKRFQIKR